MIINTKEFQVAASAILTAISLDKNVSNLELLAKDKVLYLNVTNNEFYVSQKFNLESDETFRAVVNAKAFLELISQATSETIDITISTNVINIKCARSKYTLPLIFDNDKLIELPVIRNDNKTVEMNISNDILMSILKVNSKELLKIKNIDVNELQKLYYITDEGCFTFTTGACMNSFKLEKPIKILLNDRIVKLFKLFKDDVYFSLGHTATASGNLQTRVTFETESTYVAAIITCDDTLLTKVQRPYNATQNFMNDAYLNHAVISVKEAQSAISRLLTFTKNSAFSPDGNFIPVVISFDANDMVFTDSAGNTEYITIENGSSVDNTYSLKLNLFDFKLILDSCAEEHITMNFGNKQSVIFVHNNISHLVSEDNR